MADETQHLHVTVFPFMAHGHMIPTIDMARLFAARGVKATLITTPLNQPLFTKKIKKVGAPMIHVEVFSFPCTENSLPEGCETVNQAIKLGLISNFMKAVEMLKEQLEQYLQNVQPNCLVADMFLPWATDCAKKFDIPRLVFHGTCYFALCAEEMVRLHMPYMNVSSDEEPFTIPNLPHEIRMTKLQIPENLWKEELKYTFDSIKESELKSYGVIVNSFYELEPEYAEFFTKNLGRKAWHIGPVSLCNSSTHDKAQRGEEVESRLEDKCLKWLDSKKQDSVVYICCGSIAYFSTSQMYEIAMALETSQQEFIWVVKEDEDGKSTNEYFPEGFEQRNEGKGLIIRGWAPQLLILEHEAIGAFLTHCGWNSILESISAGVPMVTWPIFAEQFYNEKLVTEILKIGLPVGAKKWSLVPHIIDLVKQDAIEKALREIMEGDEAIQRRNMAKKLKEMALKAVEEDVLFPFMAHGHMIPTLDIARLFAARGVKTTIITTHANAPTFTTIIEKHNNNKSEAPIINLELFEFHAQEAGLPQGCENLEQALGPGIMDRFIKATELLREQLEQFLGKVKPNCLVADMFFPWATESAAKFSIPRLVFHGTSFFSLCVAEVIRVYDPFKSVSSDEEMVVLPSLPHEVGLTRLQLSEDLRKEEETESKRRASMIKESELTSYGVIVNSFYELEPEYADFFRKDLGRKAWHIGPVSLNNRTIDEKAQRGKQASINEHECLKWLNSKKPYSVIYICFGSTAHLIPQQLHEIAAALEACGQDFIWVVRNEDCLPSEMSGKGLIIRGWAPQVLILEHEAVGAFLTHCGWNSTLEGIAAGVQMITWPVFAEQFYNEKLVTKILKIGIPVGAKKWTVAPSMEDVIPRNEIEKAFREIMEGVEAEERRQRAKEYKELAWKAIEEGGSSYSDLTSLINELKVFFPFMGHGHMIPVLDIAKLFVAHNNVKATIITTPLNAHTFTNNENNNKINVELFSFPAKEAGLPEGCESLDLSLGPASIYKFLKATTLLQEQLEQYLEKVRPNCLVADMFFPWATKSATKFSIPRLVFHGMSSFSLCAQEVIRLHEPFKKVSSDEELFVLPDFPHEVTLTRLQVPQDLLSEVETEHKRRMVEVKKSEVESYGVIVNSFYELEPDYAEFYRKDLGRRAWNIGPVSLSNRSNKEKTNRGKQASINEHECLQWLDSKKPSSVIYICFGSTTRFITPQLHEIASAIEASSKEFIWVVRGSVVDNEKSEEWLPLGFEQRVKGKGLLIRGWAPQMLILGHEAVGAFVTHCGWNSTLEGISAGVPMVTWPVFAEQFYNEKLVTEIVKTGISVGVKKWSIMPTVEDIMKSETIEKALRDVMEGKEAEERRIRAKKLKGMAQKAVEEGGSSHSDLNALINELKKNNMGTEPQELHVVFFPFMAHGHMIPTLDIARLFAAHNHVKATIITTPLNATTFSKFIRVRTINIEVFRFPAQEVGLPEGIENLEQVKEPVLAPKFFKATQMLQEQLELYLEDVQPNCLVADMFFPWATESAAKFSIPRIVFHGISSFSLCAQEIVRLHEPHKKVSSDNELFVLPFLPDEVQFTRLQFSDELHIEGETESKRRKQRVKESEIKSYGVIVNSFYELEPDYADFFRKQLGRKTWNIGPVSLTNKSTQEKSQRGKQASINEHECLQWLDSKKPNSIIYICFGSTASFIPLQLHEIAMALEGSKQDFIWVVRNDDNGKTEEWLPTGFAQRTVGKGLLIRGWAPQVLILEHEAIGAFVTHCGWNSTLEAISAGVPMVTWPVFAEQFYNEKLVTEILKTGVPVGAKKWSTMPSIEEMIEQEAIEKALREIMVGNEKK
ncbi:Scopoletin glucosyltransferase [Bienertia sinuspersici]